MGKLQVRLFVFLGIIIAVLLVVGISFAGGVFYQKSKGKADTVEITSQTIIDKITSQSFMVTKTVQINQDSEIIINKGSDWSNFLWGQTIEAEALVRADVGVDYSKISSNNISVDSDNKIITIDVPAAEMLDISIKGDIKVTSTSGVLKLLLQNDPNADHNLASGQLIKDAEKSILTDQEIMNDARNNSIEFLKLMVSDTGYNVEVK